MRVLRYKRLMVLAALLIVAAATAAGGMSAVWAQVVHADTVGGIHLRVVSTSADGFDSGWHTHPGLVVVQVREGSLQMMTAGNCTGKTVGPGETFVEVPYQPLRALATGRAVWTTTFLVKTEDPVQVPATTPCS